MPVKVRSYFRRKTPEETPGAREAKVIVYTPGVTEQPQRLTLKEKLKRDFAIPPKKRLARKKTQLEEFADDADKLASQMEKMN